MPRCHFATKSIRVVPTAWRCKHLTFTILHMVFGLSLLLFILELNAAKLLEPSSDISDGKANRGWIAYHK